MVVMASSVFQLHLLVVLFFHSPVLNPFVKMSHLLTTHYTHNHTHTNTHTHTHTHRYEVNTSVIWEEETNHKKADTENFEVCG